ncbi:MAG: MoxR family ATPase [Candidatus Dadabacteria bacterium]|nr:MoxR family ATPase [Candidatus Dadabacteria bacterium]MCY4042976.1 MoxR family ATPase [Candidatus Dadabacteria bacterium]
MLLKRALAYIMLERPGRKMHKQLFQKIQKELDRHIIGHKEVKTALLLGILSREHIYIEGTPGTAKTMLSEIIASCARLKFFFYQLHRDTRLSEIVGDMVISKEASGDEEIIRQKIVKGGILTAEICLLDDISRAPGESLNVLLRILNERKFFEDDLPLMTAIATSNPTADEYYNEPLDPANLDRFVLQIKSLGTSYKRDWKLAENIISLYSSRGEDVKPPKILERATLDELHERVKSTPIPKQVQDGLLEFIRILVEDFGLNETNSLITDRTFLVKALKIIRSHAVLNGRKTCSMKDLEVLKYITVFRIPPEVYAQLDAILEQIITKKKTNN